MLQCWLRICAPPADYKRHSHQVTISSMKHIWLIIWVPTAILATQLVFMSCHHGSTQVSTISQLGSTEILRSLAANLQIDVIDTTLFTPATSPTELPYKPTDNTPVSLPFNIHRHTHIQMTANATDTTQSRSYQTNTMNETNLPIKYNCNTYWRIFSYPSFFLILFIVMLSIAFGKFMVKTLKRWLSWWHPPLLNCNFWFSNYNIWFSSCTFQTFILSLQPWEDSRQRWGATCERITNGSSSTWRRWHSRSVAAFCLS